MDPVLVTEIFCGPKRDRIQFMTGEGEPKECEGTVKAEYREAFRKLIEDRFASIAKAVHTTNFNEEKT